MAENILITEEVFKQGPEEVIKIDIEEVFNKRQCHPENPDLGIVILYVIKVDKQKFEIREHALTGRQILALVGLTPEKYRLYELGAGQREILPDEKVDFKKEGIERFKSVGKHANEGTEAAPMAASPLTCRRMFGLLPEDEEFLNENHPSWESLHLPPATACVLVHNFEIPDGYNIQEVTVAFLLPPSYPTVEIDMMYFSPSLTRADGKIIRQLTNQVIDGKSFQRWSRHRNAGIWRAGIDNIETHILSIKGWLNDELKK